jgi:hypothetical protein
MNFVLILALTSDISKYTALSPNIIDNNHLYFPQFQAIKNLNPLPDSGFYER